MKIYKANNVLQEAKARINRIFDEFDNVVVGFSGGKDSTCVLNIALEVAKERNRLPLKVMFVDQEAEWQGNIDYVKSVMYRKDVEPYWLQVPFKITNSTSSESDCLNAWDIGKKWIRDKDPISIKENIYMTNKNSSHLDEFYKFFPKFFEYEFKDMKSAYLAGVRCEESPARATALTGQRTYKDITWGKILNREQEHYTFYPLYDWSYTDIWKAIHEHKWDYCKIYDYMYQYGHKIADMRISNLHHETAVKQLFFLQEIEPDTYNKLVERLQGVATANKLGEDDFFVKELPPMFESWKEYRDFLVDKLLPETSIPIFQKKFAKLDKKYGTMNNIDSFHKVCVQSICINDFGFVKLTNWERNPNVHTWRKYQKGIISRHTSKCKYI
jgi:predicted phosphoadenosine phosphosulfate sulfurtransferase